MTDDTMVTVNVDGLMSQIREGLQNVLSGETDPETTLAAVWTHAAALEQVIGWMAELVADGQATADALLDQRNRAIEYMDAFRRRLDHAPGMERQRIADRLADKGNTDPAAIKRALDYLGGNVRGDGSQFAENDVVKALERLGEMLGDERKATA